MNFLNKLITAIRTPLSEPPVEVSRLYSRRRIILAHELRKGTIHKTYYDKHVKELNINVKNLCKRNHWRDITF